MSQLIGYSRGFPSDSDPAADQAELAEAGAARIFSDSAAIDPRARSGLAECLAQLTSGDVLLVSSAARLSHSVAHFLATTVALDAREITVRCLAEPALSTRGDAVDPIAVLSALNGLQKRLIGLRTRDGLSTAASAGRGPGRPTVMTDDLIAIAVELRAQKRSYAQIARVLGVSSSAVQRALAASPRPAD